MEKDNLLFYRLRSLRSRKRIVKKDVEKQIRKKYKRSKELWELRRKISLISLKMPYQKGFVRFFVVRDDVKRSKDGDFFEGILNKINTKMYSPTRKFLKKKRKFGRRIYVVREQKLVQLSTYQWNDPKLKLTAREKQYFLKKEKYNPFRKRYNVYYEFIEPWRFVLCVKPNIITHYKPLNSDLEKEIDELDSYLNQYKVQGIVHKTIYGRSNSWNYEYKTDLIESIKYFHYKMSATEFAESLEDDDVRKF
ncbi:hypothetical protein NAL32_05940 [Chryseobacterium sp. Ch-15]|uniref:Uncharacterized protein n=1 Tax=Chryseobacterium muglaense TaxID=2893752 RepID=A0A9Q3UXC8_9FLAO|nr:hypothetical protein [Chryseobacterium muglaense]MBD3904283.1 hypothetical protein [Chryseobacterium muglaense]MCC9035400.1 hypothetical protein [Chryseobacterium muglaense]MCM2553935.1 hypothetical protein [Chryseobacterium muglaense]